MSQTRKAAQPVVECSPQCSCRQQTAVVVKQEAATTQASANAATVAPIPQSFQEQATGFFPPELAWVPLVALATCQVGLCMVIGLLAWRLRKVCAEVDQLRRSFGSGRAVESHPLHEANAGWSPTKTVEPLPVPGIPYSETGSGPRGKKPKPGAEGRNGTRQPEPAPPTGQPAVPAPSLPWRTLEEAEPLVRGAYNGSSTNEEFSNKIKLLGFGDHFAETAAEDLRRSEESRRWVVATGRETTTLILLPCSGENVRGFLVPVLFSNSHAHSQAYGLVDIIQAAPGGLQTLAILELDGQNIWRVRDRGKWKTRAVQ